MPFYYGVEKGFYKAEGIDLTINEDAARPTRAGSWRPGPTRSARGFLERDQPHLEGRRDQVGDERAELTGFSVVSLASTGIKTPKDLEGKSLAVSPGDPLGGLFEALAAHHKLDMSKIRFVQVDPAAKVVTVLEKRADALLGGADDQYFLIKYRGQEPAALRFADKWRNIVGMTILASNATIKGKPDLVKRFVRASIKSGRRRRRTPTPPSTRR